MDSASDNTETLYSGPVIEPRLTTLSDYPLWRPEMSLHIKLLKKNQLSEARCRKKLLNSIPDAKPFAHLKTTSDILSALHTSYWNCFFLGFRPDVASRVWYIENICQYLCCEHCKSVKASVVSLVDRKVPFEMVIREKKDMLLLGRATSPLLRVSITLKKKSKRNHIRTFDMIPRCDSAWLYSGTFRSTSEERLQLANRWFQQCTSTHNCRPSNTVFTPRRLIHIGDTNQRLRLIETTLSFLDIAPQYVALSYCWGPGGGTLTTTLDNIEAHKRQIPFDHLPSTIKDAVFVCRNLSINYLWVDALCIIQDPGNADWMEQSGRMNLIYSNAALTIAADESPTCTAGFWHPENTRFHKVSESCWIRDTPPCARDVISTRGWTLQERILSHRILHFSNASISWECDACCQFEDGETKIDFTGLSYRAFRLLNRSAPHQSLGKFEDDREGDYNPVHITDFLTSGSWKSIFFAWAAIIENYSKRDLTQPGDKLPAISGLASFVLTQAGLGDESYLAGLWREDLVEGLLWYVSTVRPPRSSAPYIAPTWSWASMTGSIHYFCDRYQFPFKPHVNISDAHCTTSPTDPTGRVTGGTIHLAGLMVEVDLAIIPCSPSFKSSYKDAGGTPIRAKDQQVAFIRLRQKAGNDETRWFEVMYDEEAELTGTEHHLYGREAETSVNKSPNDISDHSAYFCLSVGELFDSVTGGQRDWFLVLQKTIGNEVYKRVGIGYFQYSRRTEFSLFSNSDIYHIALI